MPAYKWILIVLGLLGIADTLFILMISGGFNVGTYIPGVAGMVLVTYFGILPRIGIELSLLQHKGLMAGVIGISAVGAISFIVLLVLIFYSAFGHAVKETNWCILLGAGLRGHTPTVTLKLRMQTAVRLLAQYPAMRIIVSGGKGFGEAMSEAECMRLFLEKSGVAPERIIKEDQSTSTLENLMYSKTILQKQGVPLNSPLSVISSDFHLLRVQILANRVGLVMQPVRAPSLWYMLPNNCIREYFAFIKSLFLDKPSPQK